MAHGNTISEYFLTHHATIAGEYRSIEHFETIGEAVRWAESSSKGGMVVTVLSSVGDRPIETWMNGKRYVKGL